MGATRYNYIDHELLRLTTQANDDVGYGTKMPTLLTDFRQWMPDVTQNEILDGLKRLNPKYLRLLKWVETLGFVEYSGQPKDDESFFLRGDFRLQRTGETDPHLQELSDLFPPEEPPRKQYGFFKT